MRIVFASVFAALLLGSTAAPLYLYLSQTPAQAGTVRFDDWPAPVPTQLTLTISNADNPVVNGTTSLAYDSAGGQWIGRTTGGGHRVEWTIRYLGRGGWRIVGYCDGVTMGGGDTFDATASPFQLRGSRLVGGIPVAVYPVVNGVARPAKEDALIYMNNNTPLSARGDTFAFVAR